jgi:hypothetical protein
MISGTDLIADSTKQGRDNVSTKNRERGIS